MKTKRIVFIDSGAGGLHILQKTQKLLPHYDKIYIADTFNAPYGTKSQKQLQAICQNLVRDVVQKYNPEIIVFACNTLTVNTISLMREIFFDTKLVGVEPALKTARSYGGDTIIFGTKSTIKHYRKLNHKITDELKLEYAENNLKFFNDDKTFKVYSKTLPTLIDENLDNLDSLMPQIKALFKNQKLRYADNLVLGCTHYIAIKEQLNDVFPNIRFFDGASAVAKRIFEVAKFKKPPKYTKKSTDKNKQNMQKKPSPKIKIFTTNGDKVFQKKLQNYLQFLLEKYWF